jgi:hypothetical protein
MAQAKEKEANVYRIDYEMEKSSWQSHIIAFSQEEAVAQLYKLVPGRITRIVQILKQMTIDAVSDNFRNDLNFDSKKKIKKLKDEIEVLKQAKDLRTIPKK